MQRENRRPGSAWVWRGMGEVSSEEDGAELRKVRGFLGGLV
jgi:hypothetical protein